MMSLSRSSQSEMSVEFTFDQAKCTGCQACILACTIENGLDFDCSWRTVYTFNERHHPDLGVEHLSLACNHCEAPACLSACPTGAYSKDQKTGFVQLDESKCIACRYCTWACPFGAPKFDSNRGTIDKCTFCSSRHQEGRVPACVELCPTGALGIADRSNTPHRVEVAGFPATDLEPAISIAPATNRRSAPVCTEVPPSEPFVPEIAESDTGLRLRSEWPLALFTYLTTLLVALLATSAVAGRSMSPFIFIGIAAAAALVSTVHLGKKERAWRALGHPAQSWLSREILFFSILAGTGVLYLTLIPESRAIGLLTVAVGIATLVSIDRVYGTLPLTRPHRIHSADTLLTSVLFFGVLVANPLVAAATGIGKLLLYLGRKIGFNKSDRPSRVWFSTLRIGCGLLLPAALWITVGIDAHLLVIGAVLLGELIDRCEFYLELDLVNPEKQMLMDTRKAISVR